MRITLAGPLRGSKIVGGQRFRSPLRTGRFRIPARLVLEEDHAFKERTIFQPVDNSRSARRGIYETARRRD